MKPIILMRTLSFGNGTRRPGFQLGEVEEPIQAIAAALGHNPTVKAMGVTLGVDVTEREIICAFRNHQFLSFDAPAAVEENGGGNAGGKGNVGGSLTDDPGGTDEDWREVLISDVEEIEGHVATLLAELGIKTNGAQPSITTLGQLFDFGNANEGFTIISGVGEATNAVLTKVLDDRIIDEDEDDPE